MKEAAYHYNQQLLKIIGFSGAIGIPLLFVIMNASFVFANTDLDGQENFLLIFSNLLMFILFIQPLRFLFERSDQDEEVTMKEIIRHFLSSIGPILIITFVMMGLVYIGMMLMMIPGIILFPFLFLLPFMYEQNLTVKEWVKKTIRFHNDHLISIWVQILLWGCFAFLVWAGLLYLLSLFEMTVLAFAIARMIFCLFVFPFIIFGISDRLLELAKEGVTHENSYI